MFSRMVTKMKSQKMISNVMIVLFVMQPILDIVSFFVVNSSLNIVTTFFRMLVFGVITLYAFVISDKKKHYFIMAGVLAIFWMLHMVACFSEGYVSIFQDITMYVRTIQMPVFTLAFITFLENSYDLQKKIGKVFLINYVTISASIILSYAVNRPEFTYSTGYGIKGWFFTGNAQSCIISVMAPLALCYVYQKKSDLLLIVTVTIAFANMYLFGTRVAYYSIFVVAVAFIVFLIWNREKRWQTYAIVIVALMICALGYKVSPCYLQQYRANISYGEWETEIENILEESQDDTSKEQIYDMAYYKEIYSLYCEKLVDRFGLEKVVEKYNYSTDVSDVISNRDLKVNYSSLVMDEKNMLSHLFGYEYIDFIYDGEVFDPENDFPAIYFSNGYVGLGLYVCFILYFVLVAIKSIIRDKGKISLEKGMLGTALVLMLGTAQLSGNVLRRPNVSIYMSVMLASLFISCIKKEKNEVMNHE